MVELGYQFKNEALLAEALTTPACKIDRPEMQDNQRLEFLGDAVLGLLAAEGLYDRFNKDTEGSLTVKRTQIVSTVALCDAANRLGLTENLRRNKGATPLSPHAKTIADAVEAVIGAAYLDGGLLAARQIFKALGIGDNADDGRYANPKGELQVRAQAMTPPQHPAYELLNIAGKSHAPTFTVRVAVKGMGEATASAGSRREAEANAAAKLLESVGG